MTVHFRCLHAFYYKKDTFKKYCLIQWLPKLPGSFEIHLVKQYQVNLMGIVGIVNTKVYKTKPILTGLGHGELF